MPPDRALAADAAALRFAQSFLVLFDKATDVAKPRIEEARQHVEHLRGGNGKKPRRREREYRNVTEVRHSESSSA
jgi:hypothetical protein